MSRYAIIFRTHFWDDFARRQFARLQSKVGHGDVYILVDETNGPVQGIEHDRVERITEGDVLALGLARAGEGNLLWFNGDYPLYLFLLRHPNYEYYLQLEYDAVFNIAIDDLVNRAAQCNTDFVGLPTGGPVRDWHWLPTCAGVYPPERTQHQLICISLFSVAALRFLHMRRLEMSAALAAGTQPSWPYCEAFIPTELAEAGFGCQSLADYGEIDHYDHWPPLLERDLRTLSGAFLHPVLDDARYAASLLKYKIGLAGYLQPNSLFHRKARRLPPAKYLRLVLTSFVNKAVRSIRAVLAARMSMKEAA